MIYSKIELLNENNNLIKNMALSPTHTRFSAAFSESGFQLGDGEVGVLIGVQDSEGFFQHRFVLGFRLFLFWVENLVTKKAKC